ncbi:hypothetical protein TNCV_61201 [Trichonephila clavipes]|nr:hypothetical protein TNCV_61201 [Trichonephila clavipes]
MKDVTHLKHPRLSLSHHAFVQFHPGMRIHGFMSLTSHSQSLSTSSIRNRDSSLHATRFQSSTLPSLCSLAQVRRAARRRASSNGTLEGQWLPKTI